jgi:integral membrane sensor domain MASE1
MGRGPATKPILALFGVDGELGLRATHSQGVRARLPYLLKVASLALAYFAMGRLGLSVPFTSGNVSPVWPPAGIALGGVPG